MEDVSTERDLVSKRDCRMRATCLDASQDSEDGTRK